MTLEERIAQPGAKKILALDGGGIRGLMAVEVLLRLEDLLRVIGSVRAVFPHVWLYVVGGQGMIIAGESARIAPDSVHAEMLLTGPAREVIPDLTAAVADAQKSLYLDPAGVDHLLSKFGPPMDYWVSTDDNMALEYGSPRGNVLDGRESYEVSLRVLASVRDSQATRVSSAD